MRVLIDDGLSLGKKLTGIGWYTKEVIAALKELGAEVSQPSYPTYFTRLPNFVKRFLYLNFFSKRYVNSTAYDYIHYTNFYMPPYKHSAKVIVTIHDLSPFIVPDTFPFYYRQYARKSIIESVKYADKILSDSESVAEEIKEHFPQTATKVNVLYNLIRFKPVHNTDSVKKQKIFLYVGVIEKRKNIDMLCSAFTEFSKKYSDAKLILVGKPGYGFEAIKQHIYTNDAIIYKNYVSEEELLTLYKEAAAFVFPSLYEGFGKPLVEAMWFSLPIIASEISTNLEINERHGCKFLLFNKKDIPALSAALEKAYLNTPQSVVYEHLDVYSSEKFKETMLTSVYNF